MPHIKDGKLIALAVSSTQRSSLLKDVPTLAESGLPGFDYNLWVGMFGPASLPPELVDKISKDVQRALTSAEIKERFANLGAEPMPMTPTEFRAFTRSEVDTSGEDRQSGGNQGAMTAARGTRWPRRCRSTRGRTRMRRCTCGCRSSARSG